MYGDEFWGKGERVEKGFGRSLGGGVICGIQEAIAYIGGSRFRASYAHDGMGVQQSKGRKSQSCDVTTWWDGFNTLFRTLIFLRQSRSLFINYKGMF